MQTRHTQAKIAKRGSISAGLLSCVEHLSAIQDQEARTHPVVDVQSADTGNFGIQQVEAVALQVRNHSVGVVTLRNDGDTALGCPSQQDLGGCYVT